MNRVLFLSLQDILDIPNPSHPSWSLFLAWLSRWAPWRGVPVLFFILSLATLPVSGRPYHTIRVDGNLADWSAGELLVDDPNDSMWDPGTGKNEIQKIYITWDKDALYIGLAGKTHNYGLLMFLDVDSRSQAGVMELLSVSTWNRKIIFKNFYPEFFYGSWSGSDGNFYQLDSSTRVTDVSGYTTLKTDRTSVMPGSEMRLPWSLLYELGDGRVRPGAVVSVFASLCTGDISSELYQGITVYFGYLGGDTAPNNSVPVLNISTITNFASVKVDTNNDGIPDDFFSAFGFLISGDTLTRKVFSPFGVHRETRLTATLNKPANITVKVFNLKGDLIRQIASKDYRSVVDYVWDGRNDNGEVVPSGVYVLSVRAETGSGESIRKNYAVAVIK